MASTPYVQGSAGRGSVFAPTPSPRQAAAQVAANHVSTTQQYLNYLATNMGRLAGNQANSEIKAQVSPLLAGLNAAQTTGQQAINGYTKQFAGELGKIGPQVAGAYQTAETQQGALDAAIAEQLRGAGAAASQNLTDTLAARGQDTSVAAQAAQTGQGLAGASFATGSASLANLLARGAAANTYSAQLPGLAALSGLQATKGLQADVTKERATILSDAQKQYPALLHNATQDLLGQQRNATSILKVQESALKDGMKPPKTFGSASSGYYTVDPTTGQITQVTNPVVKPTRDIVVGSDKTGRFLVNPVTGQRVGQITEPVKATPKAPKGQLTAAATTKLVQGWTIGKIQNSRVAALDSNGKPIVNNLGVPQYVTKSGATGKLDYNSQIQALVAAGKTRAQATTAVNSFNAPGSNGRPWGALAAPTAKQTVALAAQNGLSIEEARTKMRAARLPADAIENAISTYTGPWLPRAK